MPIPKFNLSKLRDSVSAQQRVTREDIRNLLLLDRLQSQIRKESIKREPLKEGWVRCSMILNFANKDLDYGMWDFGQDIYTGKSMQPEYNMSPEFSIKYFIREYFTIFKNKKTENYFDATEWEYIHGFSELIHSYNYGQVFNSIEIISITDITSDTDIDVLEHQRDITVVFDFNYSKYMQKGSRNVANFMNTYSKVAERSFDIGDVNFHNLESIDTSFVDNMNEIYPEHPFELPDSYDDLYIYLGLNVDITVLEES